MGGGVYNTHTPSHQTLNTKQFICCSIHHKGKGRTRQKAERGSGALMEGLIPLVYKAFTKNKTRRQYERLSVGAALSYNIPDFYTHEAPQSGLHFQPSIENTNAQEKGHRRFWSVHEDFSGGFSSPADRSITPASRRFRGCLSVRF